ncbi:TrbI/VirB10 family protein [Mastigocoleus sp. MO_188.B34]|uniref:TrbI/VirB10 family protein n=1 Tax=Mastigocoleus sp. MO_188.B34 TaxID=3036635 RepID=UPI00260F0D7F|nr:TrbI/VirB10 family protein [Mastigocoleus sp. MO_188.B34]MDJ0696932.1 TrbI/VirB10 family protein [Mastigocoleus sp. MO_188.B34]
MSTTEEDKKALKANELAVMAGATVEEENPTPSPEQISTPEVAEPEQMVTTREVWRQPWIKMGLVFSVVLVFIVFFGGLVNQGIQAVNSTDTPDSDTQSEKQEESTVNETDQTGELKTKVALTTQKRELQNLNVQPTPPVEDTSTAEKTSEPDPKVIPTPPKPKVVYVTKNPTPPQLYRTNFPKPPVVRPEPKPVVTTQTEKDPMEEWLAASNTGVYGSNNEIGEISQQTTQTEGIEGGSGEIASSLSGEQNNDLRSRYANDYSGKRILVGSYTQGKLKTPVMWGGNIPPQENQSYLIQLSKPLKGSNGDEVLPKNSYIVAKVTNSSSSKFIQMQATSVLINNNGDTEEKKIPENSIEILASHGKPLKAKSSHSGENVGNIVLTSILGGVEKAAEIENQGNSVTSINSLGVSSITNNGNKNLAAGFAEGSLKQILSRTARNQEEHLQRLRSQPRVFIIKPDTDVRLFVNRTIYL